MGLRRFELINDIGEELNLLSKDTFLQNPDGLGFSERIELADLNGFYAVSERKTEQQPITGEIVFASYNLYHDFVTGFAKHREMTMIYTAGSHSAERRVILQRIGKTELEAGRLICPVDFACLTPWYVRREFEIGGAAGGVGKRYDYTYSYTYKDAEAGDIVIDNTAGSDGSPCRLTIFGAVKNPRWALTVGGEVTATGSVNLTVRAGEKLVIDSNPEDLEIAVYNSGGQRLLDAYQLADFNTERFLYIPSDECTVRVTHEGISEISAFCEVMATNESI